MKEKKIKKEGFIEKLAGRMAGAETKNTPKKPKKELEIEELEELEDSKEELKGIDGWMILPTLDFIISALAGGVLSLIFLFIIRDEEYLDYLSFIIWVILCIFTFLIIYTLVLEFKHKKKFPKLAIIVSWIRVVFIFPFLFLDEVSFFYIFIAIINALIWTWYFRVSKRVKNTFVK